MTLTMFIGLLGALLVLAFAANRLARRTGVPDILVLMVVGLLLGPVFHLVDASKFEPATRGFGTIALILIIFEAGLELKLREALRYFPAGLLLSFLSYVLCTIAVTEVCVLVLHLSFHSALLAGAALGCASSAVVLPVLQQVDLRPSARITLMVEASFGDALGVLTVGSMLGSLVAGTAAVGAGAASGSPPVARMPGMQVLLSGLAGNFFLRITMSLVIALVAGFLWSRLLPLLSDERSLRMLTLGAVLMLYFLADAAHASDLFTVMAFGVVLTNLPERGVTFGNVCHIVPRGANPQDEILHFHSELGFLVRTFFFVLIGAIIRFGALRKTALLAMAAMGTLFLVRVIAVQASRLAWRKSTRRERELAMMMFPRGMVTAVLALEIVERRGPEVAFLIPLAFGLILLTNLLLLVGTVRMRTTRDETDSALRPAAALADSPAAGEEIASATQE